MGDLIEQENKKKIRPENVSLYYNCYQVLPLRLELTVKRAYFIICESPLPTVLYIHCSVSLIIMNRVIIPTIHHSQS